VQVFSHRQSPRYLELLRTRLAIDGPDGLCARAIKISSPRTHDGKQYERCARIDFAGIAATTLFDIGRDFTNGSVALVARDVFRRARDLNDRGIFVKLRILLVYPFSAYAFSRIQAEATANRSAIDEPVYPRNLDVVEAVDQRMFAQSNFVITQTHMLDHLQEWIDESGWDRNTLNRVSVRFVPTSPNFCLLFVNDAAFLDPYLLAKQRRTAKSCALLGPLVHVERGQDPEAFDAMDDHFRYLWDLDLSLYCEDATLYERSSPRTLSRIKPPAVISFDGKASAIKEKKPDLSEDDTARWKSRMGRVLNKFGVEPAPTPGSETLFITCSWKTEDGQSSPNAYAAELSKLLEKDFGRARKQPLLSVFIMEGVAGDFFTQQLYARLNESTLGLVLLTADVKARDKAIYSRPNVYHELGYLMKQLGPKRVAIVCENGVTVPSNIHDVIRIDFQSKKLILVYAKIAGWVLRSAALGAGVRKDLEKTIIARIDEATVNGSITASEGTTAKQRVPNYLQPSVGPAL